MFKGFKQFLLEMAVPLSVYKSVMKKLPKKWSPRKKYFEIFSHYNTGPRKNKKPYRIYFPIEFDLKSIKLQHTSEQIMNTINIILKDHSSILNGVYQINSYEQYVLGLAENENGKRVMKVGKLINKILKKIDDDKKKSIITYLNMFEQDSIRRTSKKSKYTVVISHHPYDIIGMSTKRGWTSCMELYPTKGKYSYKIVDDIKQGTIIAYIVENSDLNIQNPIGRILIKPFVNFDNPNDFIILPENKVYGTNVKGFVSFINKWCTEVNDKFLGGISNRTFYCLAPGLYNDGTKNIINVQNVNITQIYNEFLNGNINKDVFENFIIRLLNENWRKYIDLFKYDDFVFEIIIKNKNDFEKILTDLLFEFTLDKQRSKIFKKYIKNIYDVLKILPFLNFDDFETLEYFFKLYDFNKLSDAITFLEKEGLSDEIETIIRDIEDKTNTDFKDYLGEYDDEKMTEEKILKYLNEYRILINTRRYEEAKKLLNKITSLLKSTKIKDQKLIRHIKNTLPPSVTRDILNY